LPNYISFYSIITDDAEPYVPPQIQNLNRKVFYVALGDKLTVTCEGIGFHKATVTWYQGNMNEHIYESIGICNNKSETYCVGPDRDIYKQLRVRALLYKSNQCAKALASISNTLEVVIADWNDTSYRCVTSANHPSSNGVKASQEVNLNIYIG